MAVAWAPLVDGYPSLVLQKKLDCVKIALRCWNRTNFGIIKDRLRILSTALDSVQQLPLTGDNPALKASIQSDIHEQLNREQLLWKQRYRVAWLVSKDLNTKFFHMSTIVCRNRNTILTPQVDDGSLIRGRVAIGDALVPHFYHLLPLRLPLSSQTWFTLLHRWFRWKIGL